VGADIEAVAKTMATLTDKNLVVDPKVHGTISLSTDKPVNAAQAWGLFVSALRLQMFSVVEVNGLYKVLPEADAKLQGGSVSLSTNAATPGSGQVVTQIFRLEHESANNLLNVLRPLISPNNTINVSPNSNALVITDYGDNLQRLARIIASLDVANASDVEVIPLKSAIATDLAPLVSRLLDATLASGAQVQGSPPSNEAGGYKTTIIAEPRSNALILRAANPSRATQARNLIEKLDRPSSDSASGNIHVVYLKNADATKLAAQGKLKDGVGIPDPTAYYSLTDFVKSALEGKPAVCTAADGLATVAVSAAILKALSGTEASISPDDLKI
jgi:general secretion pathway protein D